MNTFSGTWFLASLVIVVGCVLIGAGGLAALAIEGREVGWLRAAVFAGSAAPGLLFCLLGALAKVFLQRAEDEDKEYRLVLRSRVEPAQGEQRYQPGSLNL